MLLACPRCTFDNEAHAKVCAICEIKLDLWSCPRCTLNNLDGYDRCKACDFKREIVSNAEKISIDNKVSTVRRSSNTGCNLLPPSRALAASYQQDEIADSTKSKWEEVQHLQQTFGLVKKADDNDDESLSITHVLDNFENNIVQSTSITKGDDGFALNMAAASRTPEREGIFNELQSPSAADLNVLDFPTSSSAPNLLGPNHQGVLDSPQSSRGLPVMSMSVSNVPAVLRSLASSLGSSEQVCSYRPAVLSDVTSSSNAIGPSTEGSPVNPQMDVPIENELILRGYQWEIAKRSLSGENDVIVLPTGTGKTYVAIQIIIDHFTKRGENSKVLFMVPNRVLAQQQYEKIQRYLPEDKARACVRITGEDGNFGPDRMEETFKDPAHLVFVLTPQMLENYLRFLDFEEPPTLADFSLLIFDECHHADKKHVYNKLLFRYMDLSKQPAYAARLPQIVGLTATVGVGESKNKSDAVDFIIGLVARMHLSAPPSRVTDNLQELHLHTSRPVSNSWEMTYHTIDEFTKIIDQTMEEIEKMVITKLKKPDFKDPIQFYGDRTTQAYMQDCIKLTGDLSIRLEHEHLREDTHFCIVAVEHLKVYARALDIAALVRRSDCVKYINKKLSKPENTKIVDFKRSFEATKEKLDTVARDLDEKAPNAKLTHLQYLLNKIVSEKGTESRVLIFAQQRSVCHSLATWLATLGDQWKPRPFTSRGKSAEDVGMSPAQQTAARSGFDNGKYNVLVSTSLAEEGIDIQHCNAVIKYMYIKDMRSSVQIRGRTRAMVGVVYSIVDAKLEEKEKENREKERWMIEAMETIKDMESGDFAYRVRKEKDTIYEEMKQEFLEKTKKNRLKQSAGDILCAACGAKLSCVANIRCYMDCHHLVFDRDLLDNKVTPYPDRKPERPMDGIQPYGQFLCAGARCAKRIGTIVIVKGMTLAEFSIKSIRVCHDKNTFKKWSDLKEKYIVTEISYRALLKDGPSYQIVCPKLR